MATMTYVAMLVWDNLIWAALVAALFLLLSPYQIWQLLTNNRPARGTGWKMWLADRYIQIWLARGVTDSSDLPSELCTPLGSPGTTMHRDISRKSMDTELQKYWLVRRVGDTVSARRDLHLYACNWLTYFFCRWYLTLLCGDTRRYYQELSRAPSRIHKIFQDAAKEFLIKMLKIIGLLILIFVLLKTVIWLFPLFAKSLEYIFSHAEVPQLEFSN